MDSRAISRYIFSPWVIGGSIVVGVSLLCASLTFLSASRSRRNAVPPATAIVNVIPMPSVTPTSTITPTISPDLTPTLPVPPAAGDIVIGDYVQVTGTGGDGVRLRSDPGLNGTILFLGLEAEVFQVSDGPRQVDGYTWWFLVAPYDNSVRGWAVANYLAEVQNP